jgi:predicted kinase
MGEVERQENGAVPGIERLLLGGPVLVAMVGPAGAGKSRWIERHVPENLARVSLDVGRGVVSPFGCACDQDPMVTALAVELAVTTAAGELGAGRSVVWDATNAEHSARALLTLLAVEHGARSAAVVLLPPLEVVHRRNATRSDEVHVCGFSRRVPAAVVAAMHAEISAAVPMLGSSWDDVLVVEQGQAAARGYRVAGGARPFGEEEIDFHGSSVGLRWHADADEPPCPACAGFLTELVDAGVAQPASPTKEW